MSTKKKVAYSLLPGISMAAILWIVEQVERYLTTTLVTEQMSANTSVIYTMIPTIMDALRIVFIGIICLLTLIFFLTEEDENNEEK